MALKLRTQIHPFSTAFDDSVIAQDSIEHIFESLHTDTDIHNAVILVEDEIIHDHYARLPPDGSRVYIRIIPEGSGTHDAGKATMWGGIGMMLGGLALMFVPGFQWAGVALLGAGISSTLGGAVMLNTDTSIPGTKSRTSPTQDPSIRGSKNSARKYGSIPYVLGRHLINPDLAAKTYTIVEDQSQWLVQLFSLGYNDLQIENDSFKVGDTLLTELSSSKDINTILSGNDSLVKMEIITDGSESALYPRVCCENQYNKVLKKTSDTGTSGAIIWTTPDKATSINVDIFFYNGLFRYDNDGDVQSLDCHIKAWYKKADESDGAYQVLADWDVSSSQTKTLRYNQTVANLTAGKYTVKVERITDDRTDSKYVDACYVGSVRAFTNDRPVSATRQSKLAVIALKTRASDMATGEIDSFNCIIQSFIPDWTGSASGTSFWQNKLTKNPASEILYVLRGPVNCTPVADSDIDWPAFEKFWKFCEDHKYYCNAVVSDDITLSNQYTEIAKIGRGSVTKIDGKFSIVIDCEKTTPVQLFTPRNTTDYKQTMVMSDIPDQIDYKFTDETAGWTDNTRSVYNTPTGKLVTTPKSRQETTVWGITNPDQLFIFARYQYGVLTNRYIVHTISCDIENLMCQKGDLIEYAGDTALTGVAYGRIKELIYSGDTITGIISDTVLPFETTENYGIRIRRSNGDLVTVNCINTQTNDTYCYFEDAVTDTNKPAAGDLFTFGIRGKITRELIITEITPGSNLTADLTCVDYAPEIFAVDDPDYEVPEFDNKITTGGTMDDGISSPKDWYTYTTYNDSTDRPNKPAGNGTTSGWHTIHTGQSKWSSTKQAKTVYEGDWSTPVATAQLLIAAGPEDEVPSMPDTLSAVAAENGIDIAWNINAEGLKNAVSFFYIEIQKAAGAAFIQYSSSASRYTYQFSRASDGYPEADTLAGWRIRVKAVNIYGKESAYAGGGTGTAVNTSGYKTWVPSKPVVLSANAQENGILVTWSSVKDFYGQQFYKIIIKHGTYQSTSNRVNDTQYTYLFDRDTDGYPESDEFSGWTVQVQQCNEVYGSAPDALSEAYVPTANGYGTWIPAVPVVSSRSTNRSALLAFDEQMTLYGKQLLNIQIKQNGADEYYKPAQGDASKWKEDDAAADSYLVTYGTAFSQGLPMLYEQKTCWKTDETGSKVSYIANIAKETEYYYRVRRVQKETGAASEWTAVDVILSGTSAQDIVNDAIQSANIVNGSIVAEKLFVQMLSAISANMGVITDGALEGNEQNYWALSTVYNADNSIRYYQGALRAGGDDQYLKIIPLVNSYGVIYKYNVEFSVGNFSVTSEATTMNGEMVVKADADSIERARITPSAIIFENLVGDDWVAISSMSLTGVKTRQLYSDDNLVISNTTMAERRAHGNDIGVPYPSSAAIVTHYDSDSILDQNGDESVSISGEYSFTEDVAVTNKAPYSNESGAIKGNIKLTRNIGTVFTGNFWIDWYEKLHDAGSEFARVQAGSKNILVKHNAKTFGYYKKADSELYGYAESGYFMDYTPENIVFTNNISDSSYRLQIDIDASTTLIGKWIHFAIGVKDGVAWFCMDKKNWSFDIDSTVTDIATMIINNSLAAIDVDELMIDNQTGIDISLVSKMSDERVPWGAVDKNQRNFILDIANLKTNLPQLNGEIPSSDGAYVPVRINIDTQKLEYKYNGTWVTV